MPKYRCVVSRVEYQRAEVEVEADNEEDAEQLACEQAEDYECVNADESVIEIERLDGGEGDDEP